MIISRTPHRISFFGGGTDYPSWYLKNGGRVLGTAIDKYSYIIVRELPQFFRHKHRIVYSQIENINSIDEINHPSVRETLRYLCYDRGISINHDADIPARSGMGSSSTFTVGLLSAMYGLLGRSTSPAELARAAMHVEQNLIRENVGSQDQVFAAHGGLNRIEFAPGGAIEVVPVGMREERLTAFKDNLLLLFTGIARNASDIAAEQISNTGKNERELRQMDRLVDEACGMLTGCSADFTPFGKLLNETWKLKRSLSSKITNPFIDGIYETALKNGAAGGKLLGAGGGGFMLFFAPPETHERIKAALKDLLCIPFNFDFTGSRIIFNTSASKEK